MYGIPNAAAKPTRFQASRWLAQVEMQIRTVLSCLRTGSFQGRLNWQPPRFPPNCCLGEEADDVLSLINISTEERGKYSKVMVKLDEYFKVRKNVIFEWARFNRRNQLTEETAITSLFHLLDSCNYGSLKNKMLWDRLVVGIRDGGISQPWN